MQEVPPLPLAPPGSPLLRSTSTPDGQLHSLASKPLILRTKLQRASSVDERNLSRPVPLYTKEVQGLIQELSYHTDSSYKQLQELCQRLRIEDDAAEVSEESEAGEDFDTEDDRSPLADVLAEFGLPPQPGALRAELLSRLRPKATTSFPWQPSGTRNSSSIISSGRRNSGIGSRMAVRLQIFNFLQVPHTQVRVLTLWRHEAESFQLTQPNFNMLHCRSGDTWYRKLYKAFAAMFSHILDENDSPIRAVLFDLVSREATRSRFAKDVSGGRRPQVEATCHAVQCFVNAVLSVRSQPDPQTARRESFEKSQWMDCLSRLMSQFERALEETCRRLWPGTGDHRHVRRVQAEQALPPLEALCGTLMRNSENARLLLAATRSIAHSSGQLAHISQKDPEQFWSAYLRQAIAVSKQFLQLARESTVLTGLWTLGQCLEGEHLSKAVLRQEYQRVRRAFADLLLACSRDVLEHWSSRIAKEVPSYMQFLQAHKDSHVSQKVLSAVIEWWRTGHSGMLRAVCMDITRLRFIDDDGANSSLQLEQAQAAFPIFEDVVLEMLRREVAVRSGCELSEVDEPRVLDILARLTHELNGHLHCEWLIAMSGHHNERDVMPPPELFQAPHWVRSKPFDCDAVKTAFLSSEIQGRFVVTRYVNRGAMGRVWVVEDRLHPHPFPLCLKTFYCEQEFAEMSNMSKRDFRRCVLEELSQVERWMTSQTRLASSKHLVRVVRVFWDVPVVRELGGSKVEGTINGILMEFCDEGELTSYLWDAKLQKHWSFDEATAQFFFAQLTELLVELFVPSRVLTSDCHAHSFDSEDIAKDGLILPIDLDASPFRARTRPRFRTKSFDSQPDSPKSPGADSAVASPRRATMPPLPSSAPLPVKYFHNDIKTENLVLSGTTLKLIDFHSLTPLRASRCGTSTEHATVAYRHRYPDALGDSLEERAEGSSLWACGVVLVRLLASELPTDWVYQKRGLGEPADLLGVLPPNHCLMQTPDVEGVRDLLEMVFSADRTPTIVEVLLHPWVVQAHRLWQLESSIGSVKHTLAARRLEGTEASSNLVWVPLTGCVCMEGQPAPISVVDEIIEVTISLSGGLFCGDGCRTRRRCHINEDGGAMEEESFPEWHIIAHVEDDDGSGGEEEVLSPGSSKVHGRCSPRFLGDSPVSSVGPSASAGLVSPSPSSRRPSLWRSLRTRAFSDRFCIQVRVKGMLDEGEPSCVWWLRVKWLPPMVACRKGRTPAFGGGRRLRDGFDAGSNFVRLQQYLLEGRNEIALRTERRNEEVRSALERASPKTSARSSISLTLPIPIARGY